MSKSKGTRKPTHRCFTRHESLVTHWEREVTNSSAWNPEYRLQFTFCETFSLLSRQHGSKYFTYFSLCNPYDNPTRLVFLLPFYKWGKWHIESLSDLCKFTQLLSGEMELNHTRYWFLNLCPFLPQSSSQLHKILCHAILIVERLIFICFRILWNLENWPATYGKKKRKGGRKEKDEREMIA